jgi:glucan phosphoethanolaminetransferase (alkaline phosphatase superfamily)
MKRNLRLSTVAGLVALVAGAAWLPFFYFHLFTAMPSELGPWQAAIHQVAFDLSSQSPSAVLMAFWYSMPLLWFVLAALLLSISRFTHAMAWVLIGAALFLAFASSAMLGWGTIFLFGVPAVLAVVHLRRVQASPSIHAGQGGSVGA